MIEFVHFTKRPEMTAQIKALYYEAFPRQERAPWFLLRSKLKSGMAEFYGIYDEKQFIGLLYQVYFRDIVFVFYLAIRPGLRGRGYGSAILDQVKLHSQGKRVILNIEAVDSGENRQERVKRKQFYLKNGFQDSGFQTREKHVVYDMLWYGGKVSCSEYLELMEQLFREIILPNFL